MTLPLPLLQSMYLCILLPCCCGAVMGWLRSRLGSGLPLSLPASQMSLLALALGTASPWSPDGSRQVPARGVGPVLPWCSRTVCSFTGVHAAPAQQLFADMTAPSRATHQEFTATLKCRVGESAVWISQSCPARSSHGWCLCTGPVVCCADSYRKTSLLANAAWKTFVFASLGRLRGWQSQSAKF